MSRNKGDTARGTPHLLPTPLLVWWGGECVPSILPAPAVLPPSAWDAADVSCHQSKAFALNSANFGVCSFATNLVARWYVPGVASARVARSPAPRPSIIALSSRSLRCSERSFDPATAALAERCLTMFESPIAATHNFFFHLCPEALSPVASWKEVITASSTSFRQRFLWGDSWLTVSRDPTKPPVHCEPTDSSTSATSVPEMIFFRAVDAEGRGRAMEVATPPCVASALEVGRHKDPCSVRPAVGRWGL